MSPKSSQEKSWEGLSPSSQKAFMWAATRAAARSSTEPTPSPVVSGSDLMVGVAKAHGVNSELYELFDYLGVSVSHFLGGFKAEGVPGINELTKYDRLSSFPAYDGDVSVILARSFELRRKADRFNKADPSDIRVHLKDLFGGIFTTQNEASRLLEAALNSAPIAYEALTASYLAYLKEEKPGEKYDQFLAQRHPYSAYSGYDSDSRASEDLIGIGPEVNAFAYLIAAKNLKPPLAIGLFGDWGSGKSYFMEQLRKRIYKITEDVSKGGKPQRDIDIYKSIVQIEFNAWHYVEGELWASLVEHIFSNLQMNDKDRPDLLQQRKEHWLKELSKAELLEDEIRERKRILEEELDAQHAKMDAIEAERQTQLQALEDIKEKGPLGLLKSYEDELNEQLGTLIEDETFSHLLALLDENEEISDEALQNSLTAAANTDDIAAARGALLQLSQSTAYPDLKNALENEQEEANLGTAVVLLNLDETFNQLKANAANNIAELGIEYEDAAELAGALQDLKQTIERGDVLVTSIQQRGWYWTLAVIGLALLGPVVGIFLTLQIPQFPPLGSLMASIGVFMTSLTIGIKTGTKLLSRSLDNVEAAEKVLERSREATESVYAERLAPLERRYEQTKVEYDLVKKEEAAITRQIDEIQRELQGLTPGTVLLDFIEERVGSDDYRKHLGVAALIRRDFDQLWRLIERYNKGLEKEDAVEHSSAEGHTFSRIVLYIDDLDRCPPERVVDVLQAVHLLLAFRLFVVVVAVDARWLAQSLQKHYEDLLVTARNTSQPQLTRTFIRQATPHDYLEKIFQVPFWIRPLPAEARLRMVQGLVTGPDDKAGEKNGQKKGKSPEKKSTFDRRKEPRIYPTHISFKTDPKPRSLEISKDERLFMNEIGVLLGETPRSVKRFVNVYRLIKSVALPYSSDFVAAAEFADYKLVLFLLAIVTGMPSISRTFYLQLGRSQLPAPANGAPHNGRDPGAPRPAQLNELLDELSRIIHGNGQVPEQALNSTTNLNEPANDSNSANSLNDASPSMDVPLMDYDTIEAVRDLDRLTKWVQEYQEGKWGELDLDKLAGWTPHVARFSYRIEEV